LLAAVGLAGDSVPLAAAGARDFPVRVPDAYLRRIAKRDPRDPLLLQVLPRAEEDLPTAGFGADPVGERKAMVAPGLLHKYRGRALLVATAACPIHCRYCFRRHFPYRETDGWRDGWRQALAALRRDRSIRETILSGGDPLTLSDRRLAFLAGALADIPHMRRLRIHSRVPVVQPERIDAGLLAALGNWPRQLVVVTHANHARELGREATQAVARLRRAGAVLLNQAVLLRGVNDSAAAQAELSEALFGAGILPYYLHLLDPVAGAAHYRVGERRAKALLRRLRARLPGYLVPKLVREREGEAYKRPVA